MDSSSAKQYSEVQGSRRPLSIIFFTVFVDMLGFGILIPVIPQVLANPASPFYILPPGADVGIGYIILGFLIASYPIAQFLAAPILGQLSDKHGRKRLLALSLAGTAISYLIFAFAIITRNIPLMFAARILDGITGGNISIAQAAIADVTAPKDRAKSFGLIGTAFGLGFILGPFIGGELSNPAILPWFDAATPFFFAAALATLNTTFVLLGLPETLVNRKTFDIRMGQALKNVGKAFSLKSMRTLFLTIFLFTAGFTFFTTFFGVYLIHQFGFTQSQIGEFFAFVGIWVAFTQSFLIRRVGSKYSMHGILRVSLFGVGAMLAILLLPNVWWELLLIVPFFAFFNGLAQANSIGLVSVSASPSEQGEMLGLSASVQALAQSIPPILSGYLAASITPEAPVVVASVIVIVSAIVFWMSCKPCPPNAEALPRLAARGMEPVIEQEDAGAGIPVSRNG